MNSFSVRSLSYFIGLIFISFSISPLCVVLLTSFLSVNFLEIFFIPGLFLVISSNIYLKNEFIFNFKKKRFFYLSIFILIFFILGLATGDNVSYVYSDFRTIVIFVFFSLFVLRSEWSQYFFKKFIFNVFVALTFFDLSFLLYKSYFFNNGFERSIVMAICPFIVSIYYLNKNRFLLSSIFLLILVYESIVSAMRINFLLIIFYIFYVLVFFLTSVLNRNISFYKIFLFIVCFIFFSIQITPIVIDYFESDGSRYVHTVYRTENTFSNFEEEEEIRLNTTFLVIYEPLKFIVPQGLGWRNHISRVQSMFRNEYNVLSTMDSNIFYSIYHFGIFFGLFIIGYVFYFSIVPLYRLCNKTTLIGFSYYLLITTMILIMFILKSWIFVYLNFGFIYSLLIILIKYPDREFFKFYKH